MIHVLFAAALAQGAFEPNAREKVGDLAAPTLDAERHLRYESLARAGHERLFARDPETWFPYVLNGLIGHQEKVAFASLRVLRGFCDRFGIRDEEGNPARFERFSSADFRAGLYRRCLAWYEREKDSLAKGSLRSRRWDALLGNLRGDSLEEPASPAGRAFAEIRRLSPGCLGILASYVANEDPAISRAAVRALNRLTGRDTPLPLEATREALRDEWRTWLGGQGYSLLEEEEDPLPILAEDSSDEECAALLRRLERGDIEERSKAGRDLAVKRLRHERRLRRTLETSDDAEVRGALGPPLDDLPDFKLRALELREDAAWLRGAVARLRRETPDDAAFGRRVARLMASLQDLWTEARDLERRRALVRSACDLDIPGRARWSDARLEWDVFRTEFDPRGELAEAVAAEIRALEEAATKDVENLRREALRLIEIGRRGELPAWLPPQAARFAGTAAEERFSAIRNLLLGP